MKKKLQKSVLLLLFLNVVCFGFGQSTVWKIDPSHSTLGFSIDHLVVSETTGEFKDYSVTVVSDEKDFSDAKMEVMIQSESIDTNAKDRDEHLKSADFFHVEKYPQIIFKSNGFHKSSNGDYKLSGTIQMHGVTKKIALNAKFGGIVKDPWGGTRAGLKIWGVLDRYDFGLKYNSVMEAGGLSIGREVRVDCRVELVKE